MVFVCPPKEESDKKAKIMCRLKKLLKDIEDEGAVQVNPICVPCCVPICNLPENIQAPPPKETPEVVETPNVMVCYKLPSKKRDRAEDSSPTASLTNKNSDVIRLKQSTSRELRASILYRGCDCEKRSGLQDDCPRTGCHGSPECLTKPPCCGPSEFCDGKHLAKKTLFHSKKRGRAGSSNGNGNATNGSNGSGGLANDGDAKGGSDGEEAKYKCFPAVLKGPVCCSPCCPPCQV